ncbi:permease [Bacillus timonensis]|nr:permease [Bacillus timonensis]
MNSVRQISQDLIGVLLLMIFIYLFLASEFVIGKLPIESISSGVRNSLTLFLSIFLEAIPFILLGVFASALIQVFVSENLLQKLLPKKYPYLALVPAVIVGALLPVCECAIVPVARRLIKKGVAVHLAIVIMITAPILNPIVFASTYYAFRTNELVLYGRMGLTVVAALLIGVLIYKFNRNKNPLQTSLATHEHDHTPSKNKLLQTILHASDEFFDMGKYLIIGAFLAAVFQTILDREILVAIGKNDWLAPAVMMSFAYIVSLCSEADAFVASSFGSIFTTSSLVAFLVYGPMIDFKNTLLMLAYFKKRFVVLFVVTVTIVVYCCTIIFRAFL